MSLGFLSATTPDPNRTLYNHWRLCPKKLKISTPDVSLGYPTLQHLTEPILLPNSAEFEPPSYDSATNHPASQPSSVKQDSIAHDCDFLHMTEFGVQSLLHSAVPHGTPLYRDIKIYTNRGHPTQLTTGSPLPSKTCCATAKFNLPPATNLGVKF